MRTDAKFSLLRKGRRQRKTGRCKPDRRLRCCGTSRAFQMRTARPWPTLKGTLPQTNRITFARLSAFNNFFGNNLSEWIGLIHKPETAQRLLVGGAYNLDVFWPERLVLQ